MPEKDDEFFNEQFDSENSGSREEFENMFKKYKENKKYEEDLKNYSGFLYNLSKMEQLLFKIENWSNENLKKGNVKRMPDDIAFEMTKHKYSGIYAYRMKSGVVTKLILN